MLNLIFRRYQYHWQSEAELEAQLQGGKTKPINYYGDVDLVPMLPILAAGFVMLTPLLNWSQILKKHKTVAVYWGLLIFAALVPVMLKNFNGVVPYMVLGQIATCDKSPTKCNLQDMTTALSQDYYDS